MAGPRHENSNTTTLIVGNVMIDVPASLPDLGKLREQLKASLAVVDEEIGRRHYAGDNTVVNVALMQQPKSSGDDVAWSKEKNARRCELIDTQIAGTINREEQRELDRLQQEVDEHVARTAPRPLAQLEEIKQLLRRQNAQLEENP